MRSSQTAKVGACGMRNSLRCVEGCGVSLLLPNNQIRLASPGDQTNRSNLPNKVGDSQLKIV